MATKKSATRKTTEAAAPAAKKTPAKKAAPKAAAKKTARKTAVKPSLDVIARAAYLNYRRRVEQNLPGDSHDDWLQAERSFHQPPSA